MNKGREKSAGKDRKEDGRRQDSNKVSAKSHSTRNGER